MPPHFVTKTAFENQLAYLKRHVTVLPLHEAVSRLRNGSLPPRSVSLTFDDGHANNLTVAYPLLRKYGLPATIFLSTSFMETGDYFPFLKLKLVKLDGRYHASQARLAEYKTESLEQVDLTTAPWWQDVRDRLTPTQHETLRPMTVAEVTAADKTIIDFGAHSHRHCILKNESAATRRDEIQTSLHKVSEWTSSPSRLFSYPNGQRGDFNDADKEVLRAEGVDTAVSGIRGANSNRADMLELRRYPIALYHDDVGFRSEITGFRNVLLTLSGRRLR